MFIIKKEAEIEIIEKKSKFITRIKNIKSEDEAKTILDNIIKKEKGAVHNCYAYRILQINSQIYEKKSDDGEPGGTAGAPMLAVLNGEKLINVIAVTTRYFGGIKLGTGGLAGVYKRGVKEVIKVSGKTEYILTKEINISFPINKTDIIMYHLNQEKINIVNKQFYGNNVTFIIGIPEKSMDKINKVLQKVNGKIIE